MGMIDVKELASRIARMAPDEQEIVRALVHRIDRGRRTYGPWSVDNDNRNYRREALFEVYDALHYCAAELVKLSRQHRVKDDRARRVYVCHPFSDNPEVNIGKVRVICRALAEESVVPIAPHLFVPQLLDEETERDKALKLCLELIELSDEVRVYGGKVTEGMRREMEHADEKRVPIAFMEEVEA
jgi:hypothetical protein